MGGRYVARRNKQPAPGAHDANGNGHREPDAEARTVREQALATYLEREYRRYAIDTILDRALPDARDGLKPVQRRILYAMYDMGLTHTGPTRKSARVVGDTLGKFHPHGDASVYDAMVRMAQDFSMRHPLVDGQGNYGSADGDSAAAMRYTEARLTALGEAMLADIDRDTVDWQPNFDGSLREPVVLPARFPNLLVNGSSGIAVGLSQRILPHNLAEVCDAVIYVARRWGTRGRVTARQLMRLIPGPDLPTGGVLYRHRWDGETRTDMIAQAYATGASTLVAEARTEIREIGGGRTEIVVIELPFQVLKNTVLERVAADKARFAGIADVRDESDYQGMRVVFELVRGADPQEVLERLLSGTQMRASLSYSAMALVREGDAPQPACLSLRDLLVRFIEHRLDVIVRRSQHELARAQARLHVVEGLLAALDDIDAVVGIIRRSQRAETARNNLMRRLKISEAQAVAILDMPLKRLASLERRRLAEEHDALVGRVDALRGSPRARRNSTW